MLELSICCCVTVPIFYHHKAGLSVLHHAAAGGNIKIIEMILDWAYAHGINEGSEKGRTPLAEGLRASKDGLVHVQKFEERNFPTKGAFLHALPAALETLQKTARSFKNAKMVAAVTLLKGYGAKTHIVDAMGKTADYYINEVQLVTEAERRALLKALGFQEADIPERRIEFGEGDLFVALQQLTNLDGMLKKHVGQKVKMGIWTLEAAKAEHDRVKKYNLLRLAMALFAKIKEETKEKTQDLDLFCMVEETINEIRRVVRDAALVVSGKVAQRRAGA